METFIISNKIQNSPLNFLVLGSETLENALKKKSLEGNHGHCHQVERFSDPPSRQVQLEMPVPNTI